METKTEHTHLQFCIQALYMDERADLAEKVQAILDADANGALLSDKLRLMILMGSKEAGTYDPDRALSAITEYLTVEEYDNAHAFLKWVLDRKIGFGWGNIQAVYREYRDSLKNGHTSD